MRVMLRWAIPRNDFSRTQNPVPRKGSVGSSPTSGTEELPANIAKTQLAKEKPRCSRRGRLLQPYCNASAEGFFEGAGGAVLQVGEYVRVGVEGDSDVGVT